MRRLIIFSLMILGCIITAGIFFIIVEKSFAKSETLMTLTDFNEYIKVYPEFPSFSGHNFADPDYSNFYKNITPTLFGKVFDLIQGKKTLWNPHQFKELIKEVTSYRKDKVLTGYFLVHLNLENPATIYAFSRVQGELHSVIRSLTYLQSQGLITDELKIVAPDTYLVFTGDLIDQGPYSLELLQLLLILLKNNPDSVFYLKGHHETNNYWNDYGAGTELKIRAPYDLEGNDSLILNINEFLNTLPYEMYVSEAKNPGELIQIGSWSIKRLKEHILQSGDYFAKSPIGISYYDMMRSSKRTKATIPLSIVASVQTESTFSYNHAPHGLGMLEPEEGATIWAAISTPTFAHQKLLGFDYDSFLKIYCANPLNKSTITTYYHDLKGDTGFVEGERYVLFSGIPVKNDIVDPSQDIVVASSLSLNKGIPFIGKAVLRGMLAAFNRFNKSGGINGHMVHLVVRNDDYSPDMARANFKNFISKSIDKVLLPIGTADVIANLDLINSNQLDVYFPVTGAPNFRKKELTGIINWTVTDGGQIKSIIKSLIKDGSRRFAFFYQDDAFGRGPLQTAHEVLKEYGITTFVDVPYVRGTTNLKPQAAIVKKFQPDAIGLFSVANATEELIRQIGIDRLTGISLFGISVIAEVSFKRFIKEHGLKLIAGSRVPNPTVSTLEIVKEYREDMDQFHYPYDTYSLEGYIATRILTHGLTLIKGAITKEALMKALESLNNFNLGGIVLTFDPERRELGKYVWLQTEDTKDWVLLSSTAQ